MRRKRRNHEKAQIMEEKGHRTDDGGSVGGIHVGGVRK